MAAAAGIGSALIGGYFQNKASKDATKAQTNASQQAIAAQQAALAQMRGDLMPYNQGGLQGLQALLGNKYEQSPGYQYLKDEMIYGLDHSAAARGDLYSGGHSLDLGRHIEGLAAQDYNNWWNRQLGLAQLGQASAAGVGAAGMNSANNVGGYLMGAGNAAANGAISQGNNWANTINQVGNGLAGLFPATTQSSYGGGSNASNFGLPPPVDPYAQTNYGSGSSALWGGYFPQGNG